MVNKDFQKAIGNNMEQKPSVGLQDSKKDNKAYVKHYYIMLCIPSSKYLKHDHGWTLNR